MDFSSTPDDQPAGRRPVFLEVTVERSNEVPSATTVSVVAFGRE